MHPDHDSNNPTWCVIGSRPSSSMSLTTYTLGDPNEITDIQLIRQDGEPIGTIVTFADGKKEKAVCTLADRPLFSIEQGVTICLCKKLLGSSAAYNRTIQNAMRSYHAQEKAEAERKAREEEAKALAQRRADKNKRRHEKRDQARREREIEIQKEAYLRALREMQQESNI